MPRRHSKPLGPRLVLGLLIIGVGLAFTLHNLRLVDLDDAFAYWPALLIVVGVAKLFGGIGEIFGGAIWILAGGVLLLPVFFEEVRYEDLWPLVLVLIGLRMIGRAFPMGERSGSTGDGETIRALAFMSTTKKANASRASRGGELTAIMGGCELDLRQAQLAEEEVVVDAFAFWGGIEIVVPATWSVDLRVLPLMGGAEDNTRAPEESGGPRLKVHGVALMGGVEVRN